jgi:hypothetical protein
MPNNHTLSETEVKKMVELLRNSFHQAFVVLYTRYHDQLINYYKQYLIDVHSLYSWHLIAEGEHTNLISGEHYNESFHAVLTSIGCSTGVHCKKQGNKYTIYNKNE